MPYSKIVISSGHGLYIRGAAKYLDEVNEARRVVNQVAEYLKGQGVQVIVYHDNTSTTQNENLNRIVNYHNSQDRQLDISCHFNAYTATSKPMGTECWYVTQSGLASDMATAMAGAGKFINRGKKYSNSLYFLNKTNKPSILLEVCFVDSTADADLYNRNFDAICRSITQVISGIPVGEAPTPPEEERPDDPYEIPLSQRPLIGRGDAGLDVSDLQGMLNEQNGAGLWVDGDFGNLTETATRNYQGSRGLGVDGLCGQQTWGALYDHKAAIPPPEYGLTQAQVTEICRMANNSAIASYSWKNRGRAPTGYTQGMALSFAQSYKKLMADAADVTKMARARTNSDKDALNIYRSEFDRLGMPNESSGLNTLRHLYALMLGSGMRESSGKHCEGRDMSASNVTSDTAEAGLFQTSYNARSANPAEFSSLMSQYGNPANKPTCYLGQFDDGVSCSSQSWACYGSGAGYDFQKLCKECPPFAVETHGLTLRNLANHYGPIIRKEAELRADANTMFQAVQNYMESFEPTVA